MIFLPTAAVCLLMALDPASARGILALRPGLPDRSGAVATGDFNADGKPDLLVANFEAGDVSLFEEAGAGAYVERSPSPFRVLDGPVFITAADLNQDGRTDAVIVNRLGRGVSIRISDTELTLRATGNLLVGSSPQAVAVADFNGDARLDLAVTSQTEDRFYLFSGRGDGNFSFLRTIDLRTDQQRLTKASVGAYGIAAGDFNRDGRQDVAATQRETDQVVILLGKGNGTFQPPAPLTVGRHPTHLKVLRLNDDLTPGTSDDFQDLAVLLEGGKQNPGDPLEAPAPGGVAALPGNGDGTFGVGSTLTIPLSDAPVQLAAGALRLGAPGYDDLAVANVNSSTVFLYPADGAGGFFAPTVLGGTGSTLRGPAGISLADRDGDGFPDRIAVTNFGGYSLTLFDGGGMTPFTESPLSPVTATRHPVDLAAFNLDAGIGDDLAVLSDGDPALVAFSAVNNGFFFKRRSTPFPVGSQPTAVALGDFDKDTRPDAVVALADLDGSAGAGASAGFAVLLGSGNASFGLASGLCAGGTNTGRSCTSDASCPGSTCSYSLSLGTCLGGTNSGKSCAINVDCPSGTCKLPPPPVTLAGGATSLLVADLNPLDADLDGVPNSLDNCPARYNPAQTNTRGLTCFGGANQGMPCTLDAECPGGTCSVQDSRGDDCDSPTADPDADLLEDQDDNCPDVYNPTPNDADSNRVGDACDHFLDVVALEGALNQVEVFFGQPNGAFAPPLAVATGNGPAAVAIGNFTGGDQHSDLVVTNRGDGNFQVFSGDGSGTFAPLPPVAAGSNPGPLAVVEANAADLDVDGHSNATDNCPTRANAGQSDVDADGLGDACSQVEDPDGDLVITRVENRLDNCPDTYNNLQTDTDGDKIGDLCDNNPSVYNPDDDQDVDGVRNADDNCPTRYNPAQTDTTGNGVGDDCDEQADPDLDGLFTARRIRDNCPDTYNPDQTDFDFNGIGDACENVRDLAVADEAGATVSVFAQFPPGAWAPLSPQSVGNQPSGIAVVDLNLDGVEDLAVSSRGDSTINVLVGAGDGTYLADSSFFTVPALPAPQALRGGLFHRDIIQDFPEVAAFSQSLNNPVILINVITERADINDSNRVDGKDLAIWAKGFGLARGNPGYSTSLGADINLDGRIDGFDLVFITSQFGKTLPPP